MQAARTFTFAIKNDYLSRGRLLGSCKAAGVDLSCCFGDFLNFVMKAICRIHIPNRLLVDRSLKIEIITLLYTGMTRTKTLLLILSLVYWQSSLLNRYDILGDSLFIIAVQKKAFWFCKRMDIFLRLRELNFKVLCNVHVKHLYTIYIVIFCKTINDIFFNISFLTDISYKKANFTNDILIWCLTRW